MPRINPETPIVKRVQISASQEGCRLFRNNNGKLKDRTGMWITYGLCPGSADLIGWTPVQVTADMVGKTIAIFTAVEVKTEKGVVEELQENFINTVNGSGGISFVARSEEDFVKLLREHHGKND